MINILEDEKVFVNAGPTQMVIDTYIGGQRDSKLALEVAKHVVVELENLLPHINTIKGCSDRFGDITSYPKALQRMILAVNKLGDKSLTPLASVAGALADIALDKAFALGASRGIINNGGDIALKDIEGRPFKVAIPLNPGNSKMHVVFTADEKTGGICTSGVGGRSFTKGIATATVALSENASLADACATYLGNATNVEDPNIVRCLAEEIDSETDIPGHKITLKVGPLCRQKVLKALAKGLKACEDLVQRNLIQGALLCIGKDIVSVPDNMAYIMD